MSAPIVDTPQGVIQLMMWRGVLQERILRLENDLAKARNNLALTEEGIAASKEAMGL